MKSAICAVARNENDYLSEWVDYHLRIGFDKIFIYDNNNVGDSSAERILSGQIAQGAVEVVDYRGRVNFQLGAYNECYRANKAGVDWMAFIDLDEFVTFASAEEEMRGINTYLEQADADVIVINWMSYGDNGQASKTAGTVVGRFPVPLPYTDPLNLNVKVIAHTGRNIVFTRNPHCVDGDVRIVDDCFRPISENSPFKTPSYTRLYLRHYVTKTIEEYITCRVGRGAADSMDNAWKYNLSKFYITNQRTKEKREIEKQLCSRWTVCKMDIKDFFSRMGLAVLVSWIRV